MTQILSIRIFLLHTSMFITLTQQQDILIDHFKNFVDSIHCPSESFRCDKIQCLPYAFVCNGEYNCQDKTDEVNCSIAIINNDLCNKKSSINCEQDILYSTRLANHNIKFEYTRPVQICIKRSSVCDGVIDCRNGIDEQCTQRNPLITCSQDEYHCQITNRCIPKLWLCNGKNDCLDPYSSDELDCPMVRKCSSDEFLCQSKNQCIPSEAVCDGIFDCADESDESSSTCRFPRFCTPDQFACKSSKLCIPKSNLCDTITQCHDRSDEMSCNCPIEDDVSERLFYRCGLTDKCLPKDVECSIKHECNSMFIDEDDNDNDDDQHCFSSSFLYHRPCTMNSTCTEENQYCRGYFNKQCVCKAGFRMNETTGMCEDIDECRERLVCDHYCINTLGSYRCSCQENYQLKSDKHTCRMKTRDNPPKVLFGLFDDGIYQLNLTNDHDLGKNKQMPINKTLIISTNHAYLIDYDSIENYLYFVECRTLIRPILMSCSKTQGIYRINLNRKPFVKELIIDGRDYTSIQSIGIDWLHRNIYFVNTRLQTIDVCYLNGSFCHILLHQTMSDYIPQRLILYPEKGLLFFTSIIKSHAHHILRLGLDGTNLKLLFTLKILHDHDNSNYLRTLLTFDSINHHLYFYNGLDQIYTLNMHGDILHIQYQAMKGFHAMKIFADKIYKAFIDTGNVNHSEFRIDHKHALATTLLGPGLIFDLNRVVQTFHNKSTRFGQESWRLNSLHNLNYYQYSLIIRDFLLVDFNEKKQHSIKDQCSKCDQLCFPNNLNQTEMICGCAQYHYLLDDGHTCQSNCAEQFFSCSISKKCIPFYQRCDGYRDCFSNEDESNCEINETIQCLSENKSIKQEDLCNNITDCKHGEDENEIICGHFCEWPSLNTCSNKYPKLCPENEFYCDGKCVSITHRCDEQPYCYDGADEPFDCLNVTCPSGYFKCISTGKCISLDKVCDNFDDCPIRNRTNGLSEDETPEACNLVLNHFANLTSTSITPPIIMNCESVDLFQCKTSHFCINRTFVCDGDLDCSDSSDEENCEEQTSTILKDYTCMHGYRCIQQRHEYDDYASLCIPLHELCDGIKHCPLGDDEHEKRCPKCSNCDSNSSFCEIINRLPICQCKNGFVQVSNGSCIAEENLCNWSYGTCSHANLTLKNTDEQFCLKTKSTLNSDHCQCDRNYQLKKFNERTESSCTVETNRSFDIMLNPRVSFYLNQHGSGFVPVHPSHHVIDAIFIRSKNVWFLLYTEQRNGHGYVWQQKFNENFDSISRLQNNATQIWSSSYFRFTSIQVDWIHRFVYLLYDDPTSSFNGIEILHANIDYTQLTFVNRLTFANTKVISSINIHPLQNYLYISAYYDGQHSMIYRCLIDGSNVEVFLHLNQPILSMTIDYRHPRLYVILADGSIESYAIDSTQPWKMKISQIQNSRPYSIDLHDDTLIVMIYNRTDLTYDEIWIDKFGRMKTDQYRKFQKPMIIRYIHEYKYPTSENSNMIQSICSENFCPDKRICITTPSFLPLCILPGQLNLCSSSCHSRGICSNGHCICSNRTYVGDNCEICRLTDTVHAGCLHIGSDSSGACMCYLTQSNQRQTPYLCTTMRNDRGEIEVPCDRYVSSIKRFHCSRNLFSQPECNENNYSLIYDLQNQICLCREQEKTSFNCFNNGLLIIDEKNNSTICSCSLPFTGNQCQVNLCQNRCQNKGICYVNGSHLTCNCSNGFNGNQCENNMCQLMKCQNHGQCQMKNQQAICRCSNGYTGQYCQIRIHFPRYTWILIVIFCGLLIFLGLVYLRKNSNLIRLKYLFAHHRLHEQICLENNFTNRAYSHVPTQENGNQERLGEEIETVLINNSNQFDDPFYVDEKQPIFNGDRTGIF